MSSASGSFLPEEPLSAAVYSDVPTGNCVLTTLCHRNDGITLQNSIYIPSKPLFTKGKDKRAQNNQLSKASNALRQDEVT